MKNNGEEREPRQSPTRNWKEIGLIAGLAITTLSIASALGIIATLDYLEQIAHMETMDKLKRTSSAIVIIIILSGLITLALYLLWKKFKRHLSAGEEGTPRKDPQTTTQGMRRYFSEDPKILIANLSVTAVAIATGIGYLVYQLTSDAPSEKAVHVVLAVGIALIAASTIINHATGNRKDPAGNPPETKWNSKSKE